MSATTTTILTAATNPVAAGVADPLTAAISGTYPAGSSLQTDGSSVSYIRGTPSTALLNIGTGDFTVEGWINTTVFPISLEASAIALIDTGNNAQINIVVNPSGVVGGFIQGTSGAGTGIGSFAPIGLGNWIHCALVRYSGVATFYQNGVAQTTAPSTHNVGNMSGQNFSVGGAPYYYGEALTAFFGEVRFSNVARYVSNFVPVTPATLDANTAILLHLTGANFGTSFPDAAGHVTMAQVGTQAYTTTGDWPTPTPTGTVQFLDSSTLLSTGTVTMVDASEGVADATTTISSSFSGVGAHSLTAVYSGDINYSGSTSPPYSLMVFNPSTDTSTLLTLSSNPIVQGLTEVLTATVSSGTTPTGTVQFFDGSALLGTATLTAGVAALSNTFNVTGLHNLQAVYLGDGTHLSSASNTILSVVTPNPAIRGDVTPYLNLITSEYQNVN